MPEITFKRLSEILSQSNIDNHPAQTIKQVEQLIVNYVNSINQRTFFLIEHDTIEYFTRLYQCHIAHSAVVSFNFNCLDRFVTVEIFEYVNEKEIYSITVNVYNLKGNHFAVAISAGVTSILAECYIRDGNLETDITITNDSIEPPQELNQAVSQFIKRVYKQTIDKLVEF